MWISSVNRFNDHTENKHEIYTIQLMGMIYIEDIINKIYVYNWTGEWTELFRKEIIIRIIFNW